MLKLELKHVCKKSMSPKENMNYNMKYNMSLKENMKYKSNITQKKPVSKAKSCKQQKLFAWVTQSAYKERVSFIKLLASQWNQRNKSQLSEDKMAYRVGVSTTTIENWKKELKQLGLLKCSQPFFMPTHRKNHTTIILPLFNYKKFLFEYLGENNRRINKISKTNNLYVNTPISPKGNTGVFTLKKEKIHKLTFIQELGKKEKWHYAQQTLKLLAYPIAVIQEAYTQLNIARYEEKCVIRSTFKYFKKIMDIKMAFTHRKPFWYKYYKFIGACVTLGAGFSVPTHAQQTPKKVMSMSTSSEQPFVLNKEGLLLKFAKEYWEEYKKGKKGKIWVRNNLAEKKKCYPEGINAFRAWSINDAEGRAFMKEIFGLE